MKKQPKELKSHHIPTVGAKEYVEKYCECRRIIIENLIEEVLEELNPIEGGPGYLSDYFTRDELHKILLFLKMFERDLE